MHVDAGESGWCARPVHWAAGAFARQAWAIGRRNCRACWVGLEQARYSVTRGAWIVRGVSMNGCDAACADPGVAEHLAMHRERAVAPAVPVPAPWLRVPRRCP
eukprot:5945974-Prymnesium_polylepis.2